MRGVQSYPNNKNQLAHYSVGEAGQTQSTKKGFPSISSSCLSCFIPVLGITLQILPLSPCLLLPRFNRIFANATENVSGIRLAEREGVLTEISLGNLAGLLLLINVDYYRYWKMKLCQCIFYINIGGREKLV